MRGVFDYITNYPPLFVLSNFMESHTFYKNITEKKYH